MKLEIGKVYEDGDTYLWCCVDILQDGDEINSYGLEKNCGGDTLGSTLERFVVVRFSLHNHILLIDWFLDSGNIFSNALGITRKLKPVKSEIPEEIKKILAKTMKKDKRFVSFESSLFSCRIIACVGADNYVCQYANEVLPKNWPKFWKNSDYVELDITYEQYLKINGFKVKSKEEEIAELEAQVIDKLGCQKEHLTPVLKAFVELLKQIKASKSTFKREANSIMASVLKNEMIDSGWTEQRVVYDLLKQIEQKI